jgi:hypothetical protein
MPAVSLPPPLEKPRRRRDAGAQSPPREAPAIALPPDAAAPAMPVLEDQAAPLALFQVHQNLFDATAVRRRSATARRRRRLLLDSDSSDDDDPFRHRRRTPSQEAIDAADVAAEEAEGRRFRAMARRGAKIKFCDLHAIDAIARRLVDGAHRRGAARIPTSTRSTCRPSLGRGRSATRPSRRRSTTSTSSSTSRRR